MSFDSPGKNDAIRQRATAAARARWGEPGVVQLEGLTPEQRRLVVALVEAAKAKPKVTPAS